MKNLQNCVFSRKWMENWCRKMIFSSSASYRGSNCAVITGTSTLCRKSCESAIRDLFEDLSMKRFAVKPAAKSFCSLGWVSRLARAKPQTVSVEVICLFNYGRRVIHFKWTNFFAQNVYRLNINSPRHCLFYNIQNPIMVFPKLFFRVWKAVQIYSSKKMKISSEIRCVHVFVMCA